MSKKSNIRFIIKIAKYNTNNWQINKVMTKYYIRKRYVDKYFRENCSCKIKLVEFSTGIEDRDFNNLIEIAFDEYNKGSDLSKYIEENYPEWLI